MFKFLTCHAGKKHRVNGFILLIYTLMVVAVPAGFSRESSQRVIALAPHPTELMYKLGVGNLLVGRSDFCVYPPAALDIEPVGGYLNIDYEKIVHLNPDYILQFPNSENRRKLEELGFTVVDLPNETVDQILQSIRKAGMLFQREKEADRLIEGIRDTLGMVCPADTAIRPVKGLLVVGRQPGSLAQLYVAGKDTYLSEIWEACGGVNVMDAGPTRYFSVNKEDLLKTEINVILEFHPDWDLTLQRIQREKMAWNLFSNLEAVKEGGIYLFSDRFYVIPGPRISLISVKFHEIIQNFLKKQK